MGSWTWIGRYALVLVAALLLGIGIAELTVFKQATLGTPKLSAAALARFLGYAGALAIFWMLGHRMARQFRTLSGVAAHTGFLILPLTTLIALSAGYDILLVILRPFLSPWFKDVYNWIFVLAITGSALWLVVALYRHSEGIIELLKARPRARLPRRKCQSCGAGVPEEAKFCAACGKAAPD